MDPEESAVQNDQDSDHDASPLKDAYPARL
jgi:hypothetical protein